MKINSKHRKVLAEIFKEPVSAKVRWNDVENLFIGYGAQITEGSGSRIRVVLNGAKANFHRPHPKRETDKGALKSVQTFLKNAGIDHDEI